MLKGNTGKEKGAGPTGTKRKEKNGGEKKNTVPAMSGIVSEESSHLYIVVFPFLAGCSAHLFLFLYSQKKKKREDKN